MTGSADDVDRAEARVAAARARLQASTNALQTRLEPRALVSTLASEAAQRQRGLIAAAAGVAGVLGLALYARRAAKRHRATQLSDPAASARRVGASRDDDDTITTAKPRLDVRVRRGSKRNRA